MARSAQRLRAAAGTAIVAVVTVAGCSPAPHTAPIAATAPPASAPQHFRSWPENRNLLTTGLSAHCPGLTTLEQAGAWLETERPNLHAAADYARATGRHRLAVQIPAAIRGFLLAHGHVDQSQTLHQTALAAARHAEDQAGQAIALRELGLLASRIGDFPAAVASLTEAAALFGGLDDRAGQANALAQLGFGQTLTGDYPAAAASLQHALALARSARDHLAEAFALTCLGVVQQETGDYPAAAASLQQALALVHSAGDHQLEAVSSTPWAWCSKRRGITRAPPPASSALLGFAAAAVTGRARPTPSTTSASCNS